MMAFEVAGRRLALAALVALLAAGAIGFAWAPQSAMDVRPNIRWLLPSWAHPLGTDRLGRDLLGRWLLAASAFLVPALLTSVTTASVGVGLGLLSSYVPPTVSRRKPARFWIVTRTVATTVGSVLLSFPPFVALLLIFSRIGFGPVGLGLGAGLVWAGVVGERFRRRFEIAFRSDFVATARCDGVPEVRIVARHVLAPFGWPILKAQLGFGAAFVLALETSLSFVPDGFGIQEPNPSFGNMLAGASSGLATGHPWPALLATFTVVAVSASMRALARERE